ncbi:MAG: DUF6079 family protein, partial [Candidatus Eremiobacterota bacterium]
AVQEAINFLCGGIKKKQSINVLKAFNLLDNNENIDVKQSSYTKYFIDMLNKKPRGQVINRSEIIDEHDGRIEIDYHFKLEPEWIALLLLSMVHGGYIILSAGSNKIDAPELTAAKKFSIQELINFKHFQKPKDLPVNELKALFKLLSIPEGMISVEANQKDGLKQMLQKAYEKLQETVKAIHRIDGGIQCWGADLLDKNNKFREKLTDFKEFLEIISRYDTLPKLKNFTLSEEDIEKHYSSLKVIEEMKKLEEIAAELSSPVSYIVPAGEKLPSGHKLKEDIEEKRKEFFSDVSEKKADLQNKWMAELKKLKEEYIKEYLDFHKKYRLDTSGDHKKQNIMKSDVFKGLRDLAGVEMLEKGVFINLQNKIINIMTCYSLSSTEMEKNTHCPHCKLNPSELKDSPGVNILLDGYEIEMEKLYDDWINSIHENLSDPFVAESIKLVGSDEKKVIEDFLKTKELPAKTGEFVKIVNRVLKGLDKIEISMEDFKKSLSKGAGPCTLKELEDSFKNFIQAKVKGKEKERVRIVIF